LTYEIPLLAFHQKKMKKIVFALICFLAAGHSFAGTQTGTVENLYLRASDGLVYFFLKGSVKSASPACALVGYWMIKDENSAAGKRQYAALLAAQASGRTISITGANTCSRWPDGEDVDSLASSS
jgi:hypothetical protein